jgi:V8-like Glu-specific endopeptidase
MCSIFSALPYPFHERVAQQLHTTLTHVYPTAQAALLVAQRAGIDTSYINGAQASAYLWKELLDAAAQSGLTRDLVMQARDLLNPKNPRRRFFDDLLGGRHAGTEGEPRNAGFAPRFLRGTDEVSEPEALLFYDDLTIPIGRVPALIKTLERLVALGPSVCKLDVDARGLVMNGTAFRVGPDLLLTNWHVLHMDDGTPATAVTAEFGYEDDGEGGAFVPRTIQCDVTSIVTDVKDDWAVIRASQPLGTEWPIVKLSHAATPSIGAAAYIIQHPVGQRKRLGFVRNLVASFDDRIVHYLTDTQEGSSGSPVFNDQGRLIALHHAGGRPQELLGKLPLKKNEGIRIERVVEGLNARGLETQ